MSALTITVYGLCLVAGIALVFYSRRRPESMTPVGVLFDQVFATRAARITVLIFWWWLGWHFLVSTP